MRPDWVTPCHDKLTEGWINHVFPVNKGNMERVDNQQWPRGLHVRTWVAGWRFVYNALVAKFREFISAGTMVRNSSLAALLYDVAANESRLVKANPW